MSIGQMDRLTYGDKQIKNQHSDNQQDNKVSDNKKRTVRSCVKINTVRIFNIYFNIL